ncbi:DUF2894 domain-containing protein [Azoarcus sp. KH32C]|uniref:DUF2894 domain-containing protein n=1 Tax=Azoarcus sp. KH32C TaxID=748247 RepID=UPI0002385D17|nr:DUF2894 domain-containing protein [Azoarcus sp. KH32C]BAL26971.1 hypothetical protein AZKH_p0088 [Azoarcus sp. KH32C]
MAEIGQSDAATVSALPSAEPEAMIDALRARSAERFDPVGFRFIEALARRASAYRDDARRVLALRLAKAVIEYRERFDRSEREAEETLARGAAEPPEPPRNCSPLAALLTEIRQATAEGAAGGPAEAGNPIVERRSELKSLSYFRSTWSKLSLNRQLSQSFAQAPENAGPLNSHFLVLQSLKQMRDISPQYLEQFMSYADTLLWLDQAESNRAPTQKNAARGERGKKRKPARGSAV